MSDAGTASPPELPDAIPLPLADRARCPEPGCKGVRWHLYPERGAAECCKCGIPRLLSPPDRTTWDHYPIAVALLVGLMIGIAFAAGWHT